MRELRSLPPPPDIRSSRFRIHFAGDNGDDGSKEANDASNICMEEAITSKFGKVDNGEKRVSTQQRDQENNYLSSEKHQKKASEFWPRQKIKTKSMKHQKLDVSDCTISCSSVNEVSMAFRSELEAASCCSSNSQRIGDSNRNILQYPACGPVPETLSSMNFRLRMLQQI